MERYKLRWNDLEEIYDVYDTDCQMPTDQIRKVGKVTPAALSTLIAKLMLHSTKTQMTLSDSFFQLSDELADDFQDYVSVLSHHQTKRLDKVSEKFEEFEDAIDSTLGKVASTLGQFVATMEETTRSLPRAIIKEQPPK